MTLRPVSYTHLDVYKRQQYEREKAEHESEAEEERKRKDAIKKEQITTLQDVYKRQGECKAYARRRGVRVIEAEEAVSHGI